MDYSFRMGLKYGFDLPRAYKWTAADGATVFRSSFEHVSMNSFELAY